MKNGKKTAAEAIVFVMLLQCAVMYVTAANTEEAGRSDGRRTVRIELTGEEAADDFVKEFPESLFPGNQEVSGSDAVGDRTGTRYESLELTPAEKQLLARVVCVLGEGKSAEEQQLQVEALLNQLLAEETPDGLKKLVYGPDGLCSVELLNAAEITKAEYEVVTRAIYGPYVWNEE